MNCQKSYRRLLNFIISIIILFSGLYFNQTEADAFFDAAKPTAQSTVSGVELPISANTQINTSELLLASRTSYIKDVKQGPAQAETSVRFIAALPDTRKLSSSRYAIFSEPILSKTIISQQNPMLYPCTGWKKIQLFFSLIRTKRGTMNAHSFLCVLKN